MSEPKTGARDRSPKSRLVLDGTVASKIDVVALHSAKKPAGNALKAMTDPDWLRTQLREAVHQQVRDTFTTAVDYLGEKEALRLWSQTAKKQRGAVKGSTKPDADHLLLLMYDQWMRRDPATIATFPKIISTYLANEYPNEYGATAQGIEKRLRRSLRTRDKTSTSEAAPSPKDK